MIRLTELSTQDREVTLRCLEVLKSQRDLLTRAISAIDEYNANRLLCSRAEVIAAEVCAYSMAAELDAMRWPFGPPLHVYGNRISEDAPAVLRVDTRMLTAVTPSEVPDA